jgi:hypothetical protein
MGVKFAAWEYVGCWALIDRLIRSKTRGWAIHLAMALEAVGWHELEGSTMNEATTPTWNLLPSLGFEPDSTVVFSDILPGLSLDFGNFKLSAVAVTSPYSGEIVSFSGILATPRTLAEIHFELPRRMESLKQCAAWIVWNLDQHSGCGPFRPARHVGWIDEGRQNRRLLPWVLSSAEYEARPQCTVQRDWLRLALKTLGQHVASLPDNAIVVFSFDGSVFSIRCDKRVIAFPADGRPWTVCFKVEAKTLRQQSKRRLMQELVGVAIWKSRIEFGPWRYEGTVEPLNGKSSSEVQ